MPMPGRYKNLTYILSLDPKDDCEEIVDRVGKYEYPWLMRKSLEFALFRTYAVPTIGKILADSGQFSKYGQRRYDDTSLLIAEFTENGFSSERGRQAIKRMNQLHGRWNITNEDFLYVLSTFIYTPIYWHEKFGWRKPTHHENLANYYFWSEVGRLMAIKDIPTSFEAFEEFHLNYERENFIYTEESRRVADATIDIFLNWYPSPLRPFVRQVIYALMDDPLREAFKYPKAWPGIRPIAEFALKFNGLLLRNLAFPRRKPFLLTEAPNRTYPQGYTIEKIGPPQENG